MRIRELSLYTVQLRLRKEIRHASHARRESDNLIARCRLEGGLEGWGEGVPRSYVTGETPEGAHQQLAATPLADQLSQECDSWADVLALCERLQLARVCDDPRGCYGNALKCALELSVLDAFGQLFGEPISAATHSFPPAEPIRASLPGARYSGGITAESPRKEVISAVKMRLYGFAHCKVKVGMKSVEDEPRLRRIRWWLGRRMDVRLDANEAWDAAEVVASLEPLLQHHISSVEQPVPHEQVECLSEVRRQVPAPIMLDESLTSLADGERAIQRDLCDLFNIRLSKCGGYLNSLRLAAMADAAGLGYQLGCHPGETGILSAAGRHWACSVRDIRYREGCYDRHLLSELLTNEDMTFGYGGRAPALTGPGLGVTMNHAALSRFTRQQQTLDVG